MPTPATALKGAAIPLSVLEPDARVQNIPEAVVQDIWATGQFDSEGLRTTTGASVVILDPGRLNRDGGPDFTRASIRLHSTDAVAGVLNWSGDIEIHRTSGEWLLHRHHEDPNYNRVVLHVVLLEDRHTGTLRRADGTLLPEVVLYPRLASSLRSVLHRFYTQDPKDFYCQAHWGQVPVAVKDEWLNRLGMERLRGKARTWAAEDPSLPLDELVYRAILRALGYAKNADAMSELARRVPLEFLRDLKDIRDIEAVLFGVAGLLPNLAEMLHADRHSVEYVVDLCDRFTRFQIRGDIRPMSGVAWQYFRLRPANFPTRRIAQAAALLAPMTAESTGGLLRSDTIDSLREALQSDKPKRSLRSLLQEAEVSDFWREHVRFENRTHAGSPRIGKERADRVLMDALLPILLLDAEDRSDRLQAERVGSVLASLPSASDEVTRTFDEHGPVPSGALVTQGLHQLLRDWCRPGRCLSCEIGQSILNTGSTRS